MSETRALSGQTQTRRRIGPEDTTIPVLSVDALREGARVLIGEEFVDIGGFASDELGWPVLAGCRRGVGREDGGSAPQTWRAGTAVAQMAELAASIHATGREPSEADVGVIRHVDSGAGYWDAFNVVVHAPDRSLQTVALNLLQTGTDAAISFALKWGSYGTGNGQFGAPYGMAVDDYDGRLFVAEFDNDRVQVFDADGGYLGQFGASGTGNGQFFGPMGVAVNQSTRDIYVTDTLNHRVQRFNSAWVYQGQFGGPGSGDGQFDRPKGVAVDGSGNVWVADANNHRMQRFSAAGVYQARFGSAGVGAGQFNGPTGVTVGPDGSVWVADTANHRVQQFDGSGNWTQTIGSYGNGDGQLRYPQFMAVNAAGSLLVTDTSNSRVQMFSPDGSFSAKFGTPGSGDGDFSGPSGIALAPADDALYVADYLANRIQKFRVGSDGQLQYLAGGASATDPDLFWDSAAKRLRAGIESGIAWLAGGVLRPATATTRTNTGSVANNSSANITASCNPGEIAVGGGFYTGNTTGMAAVVSRPDGAPPNAWVTTVYNASGAARTAYCYVVCLG